MLKHAALTTLLVSLAFSVNAKPSAYEQALTCKEDCPYTYELITTPKIKKTITKAFDNSGASIPEWLFSANSVTTPVDSFYQQEVQYINISTCKPRACDSDSLVGYYRPATDSFFGVYTKDYEQTSIE